MRFFLINGLFLFLSWSCNNASITDTGNDSTNARLSTSVKSSEPVAYAVAIHGGAGYQTRTSISQETDIAVRKALNAALDAAEAVLSKNGAAGDAVVAAIEILENDPNFNAGKGAVFTHEERKELDASFMDGKLMDAGAVGGVTILKNPIKAARAVMEDSPHVFLSGKGAEEFAKSQGIETVDPSYFKVQSRLDAVRKAKEKSEVKKHGTVGCLLYTSPSPRDRG